MAKKVSEKTPVPGYLVYYTAFISCVYLNCRAVRCPLVCAAAGYKAHGHASGRGADLEWDVARELHDEHACMAATASLPHCLEGACGGVYISRDV